MKNRFPFLLILLIFCYTGIAQNVPFSDFSIDEYGKVQIEINSSSEYYYVLYCRPNLNKPYEYAVSLQPGNDSLLLLTESLKALTADHYRVQKTLISEPGDIDNDSINDIVEYNDFGAKSPFNPAFEVDLKDGTVAIPDRKTFETLSYKGTNVLVDLHLENLEYVKFYILDYKKPTRSIFFINTESHRSHGRFARAVDITSPEEGSFIIGAMRGEIVYHPNVVAPSGQLGVYRFEFEPNDSYGFDDVQMAYELLASNCPFLKNNWMYYPMPNAALPKYYDEKSRYDSSRIAILLEKDIYDEVDFMALHKSEGYGLLTKMDLNGKPNSRDIVLYEALPNELSRVGGIITTVPQTPLSHVNLRAIQDNIPNAFIQGALQIDSIANLIGKYVYYKVSKKGYEIREATLAEVETHYNKIRPANPQSPERDLSVTAITSLDNISFDDYKSFGVKAANLATMRKFGFPNGTIPYGFAVPFYFYDEFMKYNNFYQEVNDMLANPDFVNNYTIQETVLSDFRKKIKKAPMPAWMTNALTNLQNSFPVGTSIRCRSSTNNEDLPGFSGAGLYDSKTQHPDEGHISKSIKQVYASLWNFRAFDERQFYRIDHFKTAMGVLCHPNFSNEKANGVGVSTDPIYSTEQTYYLNTQLGEDLVTNPESLSIPEEILMDANSENGGYTIVRPSNLVPAGEQLLTDSQVNNLRNYITTIHNNFKTFYNAQEQDDFAMEIEFKITSDNKLAIKQARPWVIDYNYQTTPATEISFENTEFKSFPNPFSDYLQIQFNNRQKSHINISVYNSLGQQINVLCNTEFEKGIHYIRWNTKDLYNRRINNGIYLLKLTNYNKNKITEKVIRVVKID